MDETKDFLEQSVIPVIGELIQVTKEMADSYSNDHRAMLEAQEKQQKKEGRLEEITGVLVKSVDTLSGHIRDLVNGVNQSNELTVRQTQLLEQIQENLAENTSRLGQLSMVQAEQTSDPGTKALYDKLKQA